MAGNKAQTSVEFILVFLAAVVALTAIVLVSQDHIGSISGLKEQNDAENSLDDLSAAAKEVYAQGEGARKKVYVVLPSSYEPGESYVKENAIKLRARGTDYVALEDFDVHGSLPGEDGPQWVWVISEGNKVRIGPAMLALEPNSIYVLVERNHSTSVTFLVRSTWDEDITVKPKVTWGHPEVYLGISTASFMLSPGATRMFDMPVNTTNDSVGFFEGYITFSATDASGNAEDVKLPVTVDVFSFSRAPPLSVIPSLWNETMLPGDSMVKRFSVCTNSNTAPSSVTFTPSAGSPGQWISNTDALGPMGPATCQDKDLNLTVPLGTPGGVYSGYVDVVGQGAADAKDLIVVNIQVEGDPSDTSGPLITNAIHDPDKAYSEDPVVFIITVNDSGSGNNSILSCEMSVDYMDWTEMSPSDGVFDSVEEFAEATWGPGFTVGDHTVLFRCTDIRGNVGPVSNYTFSVMKNFLFASKTGTPKSHEQDWMNWVNYHASADGFNWHYDHTDELHIVDGLIDLSYYSVVMLADYQFSSDVPPKFNDFVASGGKVVLVGEGLQQGPRDLGFATHGAASGSTGDVYIIDSSHYILESYSNGQNVTVLASGGSKALRTDQFSGTNLASIESSQEKVMLGESGGYIIWGPWRTSNLAPEGDAISVRVLDYALRTSTIEP